MVLIGLATTSRGKMLDGVVAIVLGAGFIAFYAAWVGMWITPRGVRVRNPTHSFELAWDQIKRFHLGRRGLFPGCLIIDLTDGSSRYAFAIGLSNVSMRKPDAWERRLVIQLTELLDEHRRGISRSSSLISSSD